MNKKQESDGDLDIKTITKLIHSGIIVHIVQIDNVNSEPSYTLVTARIMINKNGVPAFGEIKLKLSKQAITKLQHEIGKCSPKKKNSNSDSSLQE